MDIIDKWLVNLFGEKNIPLNLVSPDFTIEDGMNFKEYWDYEMYSSESFSDIFDLDSNVSYKIVKSFQIDLDKVLHHIYVFNHLSRVAFKMNITTNNDLTLIKSNGFFAQIVPKYEIINGSIGNLKLAIKSPKEITTILSPNLQLINFNKGVAYDHDGFYHAEFDNLLPIGTTISLYLSFSDGTFEKRRVFVDKPDFNYIPYRIDNQIFYLINESYPVSVAIFHKNGLIESVAYPRDIQLFINDILKIIVTDVLDNDWIIYF